MSSKAEIIQTILKKNGIPNLWPVQQMAVDEGLLDVDDKNFIVIAPTASGKTLIAELAAYKCLSQGGRIIYLVPTSALVNEKSEEFKKYEDQYKISTDESNLSEWNESHIIISSFESFYKRLLLNTEVLSGFNLAIIDEFHVLYDRLRGFTIEKIITLLKIMAIRTICLSATFEDKNEVRGWLDAILIEIPNTMRRIPIQHNLLNYKTNDDIYNFILEMKIGPYIIFCNTKDYTKSRALELSQKIQGFQRPQSEFIEEIKKIVERNNLLKIEQDLSISLAKGIGFHHSGLDSRLKNYVEDLFTDRKINVLFSTTGLAYGMNLPARTVILWDLKMYNRMLHKSDYIPVHLYQQMAGRAGRPQFGSDGFSFIAVDNLSDITYSKRKYIPGILEPAISQITEDSFFRKSILELVYSRRCSVKDICEFFENTFYNYQSIQRASPFSKYDINSIIGSHIKFLEQKNYIKYLGGPGYQLTDLGKVVLDFMFNTLTNYDLELFTKLEEYIDSIEVLNSDINIIIALSLIFEDNSLSKISRSKVQEIETFFENLGIKTISNDFYSAYAIWNGWIENLPVEIIEERYNVNTSSIDQTGRDLSKLMELSENIAKIKGKKIQENYDILVSRVEKGYRKEEVDFLPLKGFGRILLRDLYSYCHDVLTKPPMNCKGTMYQILLQLKGQKNQAEFINILKNIDQYSEIRASRIYDFVKSK